MKKLNKVHSVLNGQVLEFETFLTQELWEKVLRGEATKEEIMKAKGKFNEENQSE